MLDRRLGILVAGVIAIAGPVVLGARQAPPQPAQAGASPAPPTGVILGQVVEAESGRPVSMAIVTGGLPGPARGIAPPVVQPGAPAMSPQSAEPKRVYTNGDGRFVLRELANGSHTIGVTAAGYQAGTYGQTRLGGPSRLVEITDAERVVPIVIKIWKNAVITGTVYDETGAPAIGIAVRAIRRQSGAASGAATPMVLATTDDRGVFRFANLQPASYLVVAPSVVTNIPTTTFDEYSASILPGGSAEIRRQIQASGVSVSMAGGVQLGDQVIQIMSGGRANTTALVEGGQVFAYPTTFHPSADVPSRATAVTLRSGEERTGVDLQLKLVRLSRVSGTVTGPNGPVAHAGVRLFQSEIFEAGLDAGFETATTTTNAAGRFTLVGVPPGQYLARVVRVPPGAPGLMMDGLFAPEGVFFEGGLPFAAAGPSGAAPSNEPTLWAQAPVAVSETGAADVHLLLREGFRVSGRVAFEGSAPPPLAERLAAFSVVLMPSDGRTTGRPSPARLDAQARFTTGQHVPGLYRLNLPAPGPPWVLRSIAAGSRDLLVDGIDLSDADLEDVVVTFSDRSTVLSGAVQDAGRPVTAAVVFVCPAEVDRWIAGGMQAPRTRTVTTDAAGRFNISGLPPGDYVAVAVASDRAPDFQDSQVVKSLTGGATRVTVALGDRSAIGLALSRAR